MFKPYPTPQWSLVNPGWINSTLSSLTWPWFYCVVCLQSTKPKPAGLSLSKPTIAFKIPDLSAVLLIAARCLWPHHTFDDKIQLIPTLYCYSNGNKHQLIGMNITLMESKLDKNTTQQTLVKLQTPNPWIFRLLWLYWNWHSRPILKVRSSTVWLVV